MDLQLARAANAGICTSGLTPVSLRACPVRKLSGRLASPSTMLDDKPFMQLSTQKRNKRGVIDSRLLQTHVDNCPTCIRHMSRGNCKATSVLHLAPLSIITNIHGTYLDLCCCSLPTIPRQNG
jgi:hypothetical protein